MFNMDMKIAGFDDELNEAMKKEIKRQEAVSYTHLTLPTNREV